MNEENKCECDCNCTTDKYGIGKAVSAMFSGVCGLGLMTFLALICSGNSEKIPMIVQSIFGR